MKLYKQIIRSVLALCICMAINLPGSVAQLAPYYNEIEAFKKMDSISFPPARAILFVGSSSFRMWKDVKDYFPGYTIINRGFGGSYLTDVIRYERDIIFPYKPKQVVIYAGENDIAGDSSVTGKIVFERFLKLYWDIKKNLGNAPILFVSLKPSPSRWHMRDRMMEGNKLIKNYLHRKNKRNDMFIDVWEPMLGGDGRPKKDIFLEDDLHMNAKGYAIWQKQIQPYLIK
ncbi:MAG: GDSL-type esterase/lipase family protein [Ferruginibacter sp.]